MNPHDHTTSELKPQGIFQFQPHRWCMNQMLYCFLILVFAFSMGFTCEEDDQIWRCARVDWWRCQKLQSPVRLCWSSIWCKIFSVELNSWFWKTCWLFVSECLMMVCDPSHRWEVIFIWTEFTSSCHMFPPDSSKSSFTVEPSSTHLFSWNTQTPVHTKSTLRLGRGGKSMMLLQISIDSDEGGGDGTVLVTWW